MLRLALDDRRCLRLLEEADAEELYAVVQANRAYLARWRPWAEKQTLDGLWSSAGPAASSSLRTRGLRSQSSKLMRSSACSVITGSGWERLLISVGYWIAEQSQGNGTVTRATAALVDHAFGVWKLNRVEIRAGVENKRSRAIPERLGFTQEGVLRQAERVGDRFVDRVMYSILADEWKARQT